jgi:hypothetical protein
MARSVRQEDGVRASVGTMPRPGRRPRPDQAPEPGPAPAAVPPAADPRRGRPARPALAQPAVPGRTAVPVQRPDTGPRPAGRRGPRVPPQAPVVPLPAAPLAAGRQRPGAPQAVAVPRLAGPGLRPGPGAPWRVPPGERTATGPQAALRTTGPQPALRTTGPQAALRTTGPQAALRTTGPQPAERSLGPVWPVPAAEQEDQAAPAVPQPQGSPERAGGSHRMPFVLLLCGLLGGALISALVISTTLAEGSFQITKLQNSTSNLVRQRSVLEEEVAQAQSPQTIAERATKLGMRRVAELRFLDLTTGKTSNDGPTWSGAANAPGYAP